jgi:DNA-binding beta-propeller fold protein YncE
MATISAVVEDSRGAKGRAELGIAVGGIKTVVMRVEAVEPLAGAYGTPVLIKGSGFGNDSEKMQISFNGKAAVVKSCTDNQIQTEVPSGATTGILLLVNENGEKSAGIFTVLDSDLAISPDYGPPGTVLTISGSDFSAKQGENGVAVNGIDAEVLAWSESQIQVHVPDKAISGVVSVMIGEKNRNAGLFRVTRVFSISEVKTRMGATLTITGEGFGNSQADSTLQFAGPAAAQIDLWSDEKLVIRVPAAAETGVLQAKLQNQTFTVAELAVNSITGLSAGSAVAGAEIELSGTGFQAEQNQSQVRIGETVAEILSWSDRLIKIRVPAGTRPGNVVVDLNGHLSNARHLNIMAITSISHSRRPVGAKLTIEGYGFGSNTGYVLFGNESVGNFSLWSTNKIEVTVPETVEGLVAIKVSSQGVRSAAKDFYAVTVSGIDEYEGWVGREITITGNSFGLQTEADKVLFNDLVAEVVSWSDSEIKVRVPVEAQSGPMFLTIGGWPVTLEENFVIYDQYEYTQLYPEWSGPRANSRPLLPDLATDADGNTFITDFDNGWVWKIAADGTQSKFGNFNMPWGIAISPLSNEIYIVDSGNHSLQVYDGDGNFLRSIGVLGNGDLQFRSPRGIAFDGAGRIYIADALNDRIQILAADESFLAELGIYGNNDGEFSSPSGVAIDENLVLYVADTSNDRIQRFVPDNAVTPANWNFAGWLGSKDPNALTPGWLTGGSSLTSNKEGGFNRPFGVAVSETGKLLVADSNNNRIQVLAADNAQFANFIGVAGITSGQYNQPLAVEVVSGNAAIADSGNARLQYSTFAGAFIAQITPNTSLLNTEPFRVAVDSANQRVYVLDREDSSITVFNLAGEVMQIIGSKGAGREQFYLPEGIAIDGSGNVYVADTGNARIHKISSAGQFIEFWGIYGTGAGQFYQPNAIAVSANGAQIFVTDSQLHRVQRFDGQGNYLNGWGSFGSGDAGFNNPAGIAVDESGNVYIADKNNHRIKKYSVNGGLLGWWGAYDPGAQAFWLDPGSNRSGALSDADGAFDTPTDVAVDNEGRVLVTDSNNFRIQLFAAQQSEGIAAGFQTEIYIGENLQALTVDDWARVYCIDAQKKVLRFAPDL